MSLRINTNIPAMTALRNLGNTVSTIGMSMTRLSTGLRINTASDDPAGLIISEGMRAQLNGLNQAIRNSQDAVNMSKTAESALDEVQKLIRDMRGLAVHAANTAVVDTAQLQADQAQIRSIQQSITRIATQTTWGTKNLLDGTAGAVASLTDTTNLSSMYIGGTFDNASVVSGPISVVTATAAQKANVTLGKNFALKTTAVPAGAFVINGYTFTSSGTETLQDIATKITTMANTTGVTADITGSAPNFNIALTSREFGANQKIDLSDPNSLIHNAASATDAGVDGVYNVTIGSSNPVTFTGGQGPGVSGLRATDTNGNTIVVTELGNASGLSVLKQVGQMTASNVQFQIGPNPNQAVSFSMPNVYPSSLGTTAVPTQNLSTIDLGKTGGPAEAMKIIDDAIRQLAQARGDLGSFQRNFLESTVRSLDVAKENLTAAESQIRDVDIAEEMTNYTKLQVLQQSGMSILAQANQQPQSVLQLLRGGG